MNRYGHLGILNNWDLRSLHQLDYIPFTLEIVWWSDRRTWVIELNLGGEWGRRATGKPMLCLFWQGFFHNIQIKSVQLTQELFIILTRYNLGSLNSEKMKLITEHTDKMLMRCSKIGCAYWKSENGRDVHKKWNVTSTTFSLTFSPPIPGTPVRLVHHQFPVDRADDPLNFPLV
jgi:hypothetical protein